MTSSAPTSDSTSSPSLSPSLPSSSPPSSALPPTSTSTTDASSSSSSVAPPSSSIPSSSSAPPPSSSSSSIPTTSSSSASSSSVSLIRSLSVSTNSDGGVVTFTQTRTQTQSASTSTPSGAVREASKGFLQNKGAVAAVFTIVGLVAAGLLFALVTNALRRRRARRFDREIAEEAKRVPAPVFVDDDDDYAGGYSSAAYAGGVGGGYSDVAGYGAHAQQDPYAASHGPSSEGYPASDAVHSGNGGTPSNYMYPSGYSDLGFSDVSSHGTFAQPPMDAYNAGGGGGGYGGYGGGAGVGAAGAYEMMGYAPQHAQVGQDWHAQGGQVGGGYVYPGEETHAQGYPPTATTANSSGSDGLGRSKSGARSLVDSYNTPPSEGGSGKGVPAAQPQYADGYVSQYQTHVVEDDGAYGGMESHHGHVVGLEDEESDGEGDGRRVLKVANN